MTDQLSANSKPTTLQNAFLVMNQVEREIANAFRQTASQPSRISSLEQQAERIEDTLMSLREQLMKETADDETRDDFDRLLCNLNCLKTRISIMSRQLPAVTRWGDFTAKILRRGGKIQAPKSSIAAELIAYAHRTPHVVIKKRFSAGDLMSRGGPDTIKNAGVIKGCRKNMTQQNIDAVLNAHFKVQTAFLRYMSLKDLGFQSDDGAGLTSYEALGEAERVCQMIEKQTGLKFQPLSH